MVKFRVELKSLALAALCLLAVEVIAVSVPIEDLLSEYRFTRRFPWYAYWRLSIAALLTWIVAASVIPYRYPFARWLVWLSALLFAVFHYYLLLVEATSSVQVRILPLVYEVKSAGGVVYKLDLPQLVLIASALQHFFTLRTAPQAASSTRQTP
ncbi:MAG: hypothetical protein DRJ43_05450 [Thermoprotei archaeon]|nr:MAG: hypothetical protein DRJ43_05450 [Thermoprotei archaeon]